MKQELAPRGVGIPVLQGREDVKFAGFRSCAARAITARVTSWKLITAPPRKSQPPTLPHS